MIKENPACFNLQKTKIQTKKTETLQQNTSQGRHQRAPHFHITATQTPEAKQISAVLLAFEANNPILIL